MSRKQVEVKVGPIAILLTLVFIGYQAFNDTKRDYQRVSELYAREGWLEGKRLKVMGEVVPGSIVRGNDVVRFMIAEGNQTLEVHYIGTNHLPDTFRDHSETVVDGRYSGNGLFKATRFAGQVRLEVRTEARNREPTENTEAGSEGLSQGRLR